ncbi:MAG: quinone-dependent dihydroorotate dehydrogenase [Ignavibacteria bacterium]|nr:quinone-dependent dihydroorotate dehydrogenase [Ignavibacteria bacterium]
MYKIIIRPVLFLFDSEKVHNFTLSFVSKFIFLHPFFKIIFGSSKTDKVNINGLIFKNRLGLAAGFDKNAAALRFWNALGFSHAEIGTVTPVPQSGNEKPRLFRLKKDSGIINRMGFNNKGADEIRKNILDARKHLPKDFIVGVNIGKNKNTPNEEAVNDYLTCFKKMYDAADYFTINISSPNTKGLRELQEEESLRDLLTKIKNLNKSLSEFKDEKNIFVKIAPDINDEQIRIIYNTVSDTGITGIILTNTTISRNNLKEKIKEDGGLSGKPLKKMADDVLEKFHKLNNDNKLVLIGAGGVFSKDDYNKKISNGASLVQIYTGMIYEGPALIKKILN